MEYLTRETERCVLGRHPQAEPIRQTLPDNSLLQERLSLDEGGGVGLGPVLDLVGQGGAIKSGEDRSGSPSRDMRLRCMEETGTTVPWPGDGKTQLAESDSPGARGFDSAPPVPGRQNLGDLVSRKKK